MILDTNEAKRHRENGKEYYFMQPRASMLGKSEDEIYKYFTTKQEFDEDHIAILSANSGTALHRLVLAQQYQQGNLVTAEKFVHNKKYNFTGHIDAVSRNMGLGDVKTVARGVFNRIKRQGPMSSHVTQVNAYMSTTGEKEGYIQYVMREDPTQQIVFKLEYDEKLFESDMAKVQRVQQRVAKDLASGRLKYSQLRQGTSAESLEEEGRLAHSKLVSDTSKMEDLIDYFFHFQRKEDKARGNDQKISFAKHFSNQAINPQAKREDQNTIEGMKHGWFGRQRSENTAFGSPYKLGEFHSLSQFLDEDVSDTIKSFDLRTAEALLGRSQMALDFETTGLKDYSGSVIQVAAGLGDGEYETVYSKQPTNELPRFHKEGGLGDVQKKLNLDLTKEGDIPNYANAILSEEEMKLNRVKARVAGIKEQERLLNKLTHTAKLKRKNIIIANAPFEIRQSRHILGKEEALQLADDHILASREVKAERRGDYSLRRRKLITDEQFFENEAKRARKLAALMLREAAAQRGKIVDPLVIARGLYATAQSKGLIPKTGNFGSGTNVELLSDLLLQQKEIHEGVSDTLKQNPVSVKLAHLFSLVESGEINAQNMHKSEYSRFFNEWNTNAKQILVNSRTRSIQSELETKGHLNDLERYMDVDDFEFNKLGNKKIHQEALENIRPEYKEMLKKSSIQSNSGINNIAGNKNVRLLRFGAATAAGLLIYAATKNAFKFSGRDDEANTVEGLKHGGWAQSSRKLHSDFGSGWQRDKYHGDGTNDPTSNNYAPLLVAGGAVGAGAYYWNKPFGNMKLDDVTYLGKIHPSMSNSEILGRSHATYGDVALGTLKRIESSAGGLLKSFGLSEFIEPNSFSSIDQVFDVTAKNSDSFAKYVSSMIKRDLAKEGVDSVIFEKGKMYLSKGGARELVPGDFSLMRTSFDLNQAESMSQISKAMVRIHGVNYVDPRVFPFIPVGGEGFSAPGFQKTHAYFRETFTKYANLMANPLDALSQLMPDAPISKAIQEKVAKLPLGIGNESDLIGPTSRVVGTHALKLGGALGALYFGYGTLNSIVQSISPNDSVAGRAGITGLAAEGIRTAHQSYARISDITGLTSFRDKVDEQAPGMEGWKASAGLGLAGLLGGASLAVAEDLVMEGSAKGQHYAQFLANMEETHEMPEALKKIPGFGKKYTKVGKYARLGGAAGLALSAPWLLAGFGADKSYEELEAEYSGEKEVAVRAGRFWEASMTPWEGGKIDYYRPNWYRRLLDDPRRAELFDGEKISPFGKLIKDIADPYWLEKQRYDDQPYPYAGPDGSAFGMFGPLYEATIGRVLKAPAIMHRSEMSREIENLEGGYGSETITPSGSSSLIRKQWSSVLEAAGLRGFGLGSIKELITGNKDIEYYSPELASSSAMNSFANRFHELQLGGGFLTTEAVRRVLQREETGSIDRINPLRNNMPSWMPGAGYHINFHKGDPFSQVKEGYYRLPGEGFATRYKELQDLNPEDYPDIFKYKILADVAYGSNEFTTIKGKIDNKVLSPEEMTIYNEVEEQIKEKNASNEKFRDPAMYETILGKYAAILTDTARANPVEHLIPFSPAHKLLPGQDPIDRYEETIYAKDFKRWSSPIEDFVKPAMNMALKTIGADAIPSEIEYSRQLEDYFDKLEYLKYQRLASIAESHGDNGAANLYRRNQDKTLSGLDPYMDHNALLSLIPKRERPFFEKFLKADEEDKARILKRTSPAMRDIYLAQWDKQVMISLESGEVEMERDQRSEILSDIKTRANQLRARRKAQIQDFRSSEQMPDDSWEGWDRRVDLDDVKMKYLINEGRDYHYYGLWKDRMNMLARKPYIEQAAENLHFRPQEYRSRYADAYAQARDAGVVNPEIAITPGLGESTVLEIKMDRDNEQREILRELGHII
ncbi:MAG: hypothetical protein PHY47_00360 [Lachnospiraceae bacterium]|nr:hypothetical protein [Lachnospiraceae bacterium]